MSKNSRFCRFSALFLLVLSAWAAPTTVHGKSSSSAVKMETKLLQEATQRYQNSSLVKMDVEKLVKLEALGKETSYKAIVYISGPLFRWENLSPEKTLLIYDGETLWQEQGPSADFGGPLKVTRAKLDQKTKSKIILGSLLGNKNIFKTFKVTHNEEHGDQTIFSIEPKKPDPSMKDFKISVFNKTKLISQMSFSDDVGNKTTMNFSNVNFQPSGNKKELFKYQPPQGAEVTNL